MTVSAATAKAGPYPGNNVASSFAFAFKVFADSDVRVVSTLISTGAETDLVLNTDYTVARNVDQDTNPGGTVTYKVAGVTTALPSTKTLTIVGDFPFEQPTDIPNGGPFFAEVVETALDRLEMHVKQLAEQVDRAVKTGVSSGTDPDTLVASLLAASVAATTAANDAAASAAAAEAAVPSGSLGFTPVNITGDTMTGPLAVPELVVNGSDPITTIGDAATKATGTASGNVPLVGTKSATEALAGLVELATKAEAETGTDDTVAMTALKTAQAIAALGLGGSGQSVQDVAASRAINTTYTNSTGKPIFLNVSLVMSAGANAAWTVNGVAIYGSWSAGGGGTSVISVIVPNNGTYSVAPTSVTSIKHWIEVR